MADTYREMYRTLLLFGNVGHVNKLAPVWNCRANCHKSEQYIVLTQKFIRPRCMSRGLSTQYYAPGVTIALKFMVMGFHFIGHGSDELVSGCQHFLFLYSGSTDHYQAVSAADKSKPAVARKTECKLGGLLDHMREEEGQVSTGCD